MDDTKRDILPITLTIQSIGKKYSFGITRGDEQEEMIHREAEKRVNEWMSYWASERVMPDVIDRLAMTALSIAINAIKERNSNRDEAKYTLLEAEALTHEIDDYLNKL